MRVQIFLHGGQGPVETALLNHDGTRKEGSALSAERAVRAILAGLVAGLE